MPTAPQSPLLAVAGFEISHTHLNALTSYYNEYWSGATYVYDTNHYDHANNVHVDDRRYGWGQVASKAVEPATEAGAVAGVQVTAGNIINSKHINQVISQVNVGYHHIDDARLPIASVTSSVLSTGEKVAALIYNNIIDSITLLEPLKYIADEVTISVAEAISTNTANWSDDLEVVHKFSFPDYNKARHFFNSGGELRLDLEMATGSDVDNNHVWYQIFEQFDSIRIGAEACRVVHDAGTPAFDVMSTSAINKGFYNGIVHGSADYTTVLDAGVYYHGVGGVYTYVYVYSEYNSRRIRVALRADEIGGTFNIYVKVTLIEDAQDIDPITRDITLTSGYVQPNTTPTSDPSGYFTVGTIPRYEFITPTPPTIVEHPIGSPASVGWKSVDVTSPTQLAWNATHRGPNFQIGTEYKILTTGTTDFTLIGAANSTPGTVFTATGGGAGTGTARTTSAIDYTLARVSVIAGAFDIGKEYTIESLGTTTQAEWNTTAGTSGLVYTVGSSFTVATGQPGVGTGTAYLRFAYKQP